MSWIGTFNMICFAIWFGGLCEVGHNYTGDEIQNPHVSFRMTFAWKQQEFLVACCMPSAIVALVVELLTFLSHALQKPQFQTRTGAKPSKNKPLCPDAANKLFHTISLLPIPCNIVLTSSNQLFWAKDVFRTCQTPNYFTCCRRHVSKKTCWFPAIASKKIQLQHVSTGQTHGSSFEGYRTWRIIQQIKEQLLRANHAKHASFLKRLSFDKVPFHLSTLDWHIDTSKMLDH